MYASLFKCERSGVGIILVKWVLESRMKDETGARRVASAPGARQTRRDRTTEYSNTHLAADHHVLHVARADMVCYIRWSRGIGLEGG